MGDTSMILYMGYFVTLTWGIIGGITDFDIFLIEKKCSMQVVKT
jgi:hypothetical protein